MTEEATVFVIGESWCRITEGIDEVLKVVDLDRWFTLRKQQLEIGSKRDHITVHPEDSKKMTVDEEKTWNAIGDQIEDLQDELDWGWEIESCLRECTLKDIERWFQKRELSECGEESAIGVSPDGERAEMLFAWQCHWEHSYDENKVAEEMKEW